MKELQNRLPEIFKFITKRAETVRGNHYSRSSGWDEIETGEYYYYIPTQYDERHRAFGEVAEKVLEVLIKAKILHPNSLKTYNLEHPLAHIVEYHNAPPAVSTYPIYFLGNGGNASSLSDIRIAATTLERGIADARKLADKLFPEPEVVEQIILKLKQLLGRSPTFNNSFRTYEFKFDSKSETAQKDAIKKLEAEGVITFCYNDRNYLNSISLAVLDPDTLLKQ